MVSLFFLYINITETGEIPDKEYKYKICGNRHSVRRLHELKDEKLQVNEQLLPDDQDEYFLHNYRCLGNCGGKRIVSPEDEKHEPWSYSMKRETGAVVYFCDQAIQHKCDVVLCGDCVGNKELIRKLESSYSSADNIIFSNKELNKSNTDNKLGEGKKNNNKKRKKANQKTKAKKKQKK